MRVKEEVMLLFNNQSLVYRTAKELYQLMMPLIAYVVWWRIVWRKEIRPKHGFIVWLAIEKEVVC